ncbi:hypothetical protein, partial [Klebsiella pneumoniae]|uniref:hypothetical protein n=1 Tax=Klebsiella pneumoniae TaxID=573 RepID=UPI000D49EF61
MLKYIAWRNLLSISILSRHTRGAARRGRRPTDPDREGANKQVISSQADSLIKISRIWADF